MVPHEDRPSTFSRRSSPSPSPSEGRSLPFPLRLIQCLLLPIFIVLRPFRPLIPYLLVPIQYLLLPILLFPFYLVRHLFLSISSWSMAPSKSTRILILLAVDTVFFFIEIIAGYSVHSLALVADSFHMLNDVISLLVGLWAVKVAARDTDSKSYTYGWQRAETLGALVNGVFLIALCLSIFLEAIQRFVEPQEVTQPKVIFIVGTLGLLSNILGLVLFHDHGHSHGGQSDHSHDDLENGDAAHEEEQRAAFEDATGKVTNALPENVVENGSRKASDPGYKSHDFAYGASKTSNGQDTIPGMASSPGIRKSSGNSISFSGRQRQGSASHPRYSSLSETSFPGHPAALRNDVITRGSEIMSEGESDEENDATNGTEDTPLLSEGNQKDYGGDSSKGGKKSKYSRDFKHDDHKHRQPKTEAKGHGHSHGDLNMRGVFLHVMGDALGNIGVIATALFIGLTSFSWRFYFDPVISLVITVIILCSAIPLCKAAARILLQAVPAGVSIDEIKEDIENLPGVISCHHIHVWQLNDTTLVASLHVMLAFDFEGEGKQEFMSLTSAIRTCLREYGIRNPTIQAEFCLDDSHSHDHDDAHSQGGSGSNSNKTSVHNGSSACAWDSGNREQTCCPTETHKP